ncbi:type III-A CRISPR-associated RAMP protein Csm4 [Candidatus Magnetominusculus xianensis]|uniref:CRISPR system Cms protein Csm4 n=1 Tax=Candidatus Magnetominusculus xianensis TaxID=1748249 RepID=A0ABR5SJQ2_9BACT|nr:hypothetical protein [Candidatus Magnetominusculus xianensis]KWT94951.1 CRISPR-associated protein Csm4 [Candidatus Magnetominusculus xianensis]MBF0405197.1 hypothetical protein [Nitrospirota bacterium]
MNTYRLRIKLKGSFITPLQADTIFGSLCWIMAWSEGQDAVKEFLSGYINGKPAFVLSDGMPGDLLPAPAHLSLSAQKEGMGFEDYNKTKEIKKVQWLLPNVFEKVRNGNFDIEPCGRLKTFKSFTTLHSSVNRITGTTAEGGNLFELSEYAAEQDEISIYIKIRDGWEEKVSSLLNELSKTGYGKKKTSGKGAFEIIKFEPFKFNDVNGADGFMSLSNFVPAQCDPTEGFYKIFVKYGKLGGEFTFCGRPFKKPLIMLTAGSSFRVKEEIKPYYGRMVKDISPAKPQVVHYGYAFSIPVVIPHSVEVKT